MRDHEPQLPAIMLRISSHRDIPGKYLHLVHPHCVQFSRSQHLATFLTSGNTRFLLTWSKVVLGHRENPLPGPEDMRIERGPRLGPENEDAS